MSSGILRGLQDCVRGRRLRSVYLPLLMQRRSHRNPQILGLLTTGDNAAFIVGKHHQWLPHERGIKSPSHRNRRSCAVHEGQTPSRCSGCRPVFHGLPSNMGHLHPQHQECNETKIHYGHDHALGRSDLKIAALLFGLLFEKRKQSW